jgi:hypothetical protein
MTGMATAVSGSAKRAAPGPSQGRGKPKTYWGSDVVLSRQGERCWHLTMSDRLVAATKDGTGNADTPSHLHSRVEALLT